MKKYKLFIAYVFIVFTIGGISCSDDKKDINVIDEEKEEVIQLEKSRKEKQIEADSLKAEIEKLKHKRDSLKQSTKE